MVPPRHACPDRGPQRWPAPPCTSMRTPAARRRHRRALRHAGAVILAALRPRAASRDEFLRRRPRALLLPRPERRLPDPGPLERALLRPRLPGPTQLADVLPACVATSAPPRSALPRAHGRVASRAPPADLRSALVCHHDRSWTLQGIGLWFASADADDAPPLPGRAVSPVCLFEGCGVPFGEFHQNDWAKKTPCDYCDEISDGLWLCRECSAMCCSACAWQQQRTEQCWLDMG